MTDDKTWDDLLPSGYRIEVNPSMHLNKYVLWRDGQNSGHCWPSRARAVCYAHYMDGAIGNAQDVALAGQSERKAMTEPIARAIAEEDARDAISDALHAIHQGDPTIAMQCLERARLSLKEWENARNHPA